MRSLRKEPLGRASMLQSRLGVPVHLIFWLALPTFGIGIGIFLSAITKLLLMHVVAF